MPQIATVVVLAAGQGKRMKSALPKVLHPVCGEPMISHVLRAARAVAAQRIVVVLGHGHEQVRPQLPSDVAVLSAAEQILSGLMLVLPGDTPLVTGEVLQGLVREHFERQVAATVLTMDLGDPTGYGRIVRGPDGSVVRVVEHRDATPEELTLHEVNSSVYVLPVPEALEILRGVRSENDQQEVYLTDVIFGLRSRGARVAAFKVADATLVLGVNSQEELAEAERLMALRNQ
jgi:bifunctional UDP-N-acetylglucosamine pyrophosphorylase/glucosamine-1-phosphate N-acetyltransferase